MECITLKTCCLHCAGFLNLEGTADFLSSLHLNAVVFTFILVAGVWHSECKGKGNGNLPGINARKGHSVGPIWRQGCIETWWLIGSMTVVFCSLALHWKGTNSEFQTKISLGSCLSSHVLVLFWFISGAKITVWTCLEHLAMVYSGSNRFKEKEHSCAWRSEIRGAFGET